MGKQKTRGAKKRRKTTRKRDVSLRTNLKKSAMGIFGLLLLIAAGVGSWFLLAGPPSVEVGSAPVVVDNDRAAAPPATNHRPPRRGRAQRDDTGEPVVTHTVKGKTWDEMTEAERKKATGPTNRPAGAW